MEKLDLRTIPCPKNTSKALIKLATMDTDETLEIWVDDGEPVENVPASLTLEGHVIVNQNRAPEGHWILTVKAA
ncbi:MAG: sulfurtransferase TusA family protein [Bdellovibrionales bacterium]|nr:sulfurtransferase TusA family protein [Bdellovibrionales bacterium]